MNTKNPSAFELYNLADDVSETKNLADKHPEIVAEFYQILKEASTQSKLFPFKKS